MKDSSELSELSTSRNVILFFHWVDSSIPWLSAMLGAGHMHAAFLLMHAKKNHLAGSWVVGVYNSVTVHFMLYSEVDLVGTLLSEFC